MAKLGTKGTVSLDGRIFDDEALAEAGFTPQDRAHIIRHEFGHAMLHKLDMKLAQEQWGTCADLQGPLARKISARMRKKSPDQFISARTSLNPRENFAENHAAFYSADETSGLVSRSRQDLLEKDPHDYRILEGIDRHIHDSETLIGDYLSLSPTEKLARFWHLDLGGEVDLDSGSEEPYGIIWQRRRPQYQARANKA